MGLLCVVAVFINVIYMYDTVVGLGRAGHIKGCVKCCVCMCVLVCQSVGPSSSGKNSSQQMSRCQTADRTHSKQSYSTPDTETNAQTRELTCRYLHL